ncbi:uncharacterized protein J8A68_002760 [[Candida] subhashii]|uniref:Protein KRE1 n=1 Tax=[Candida] subhashii TaxID=561895 RepID=A0A8J5UIK3_9ASCO|nr:uncharacterized protein J8A68_002760 [[Candida] subhashii]KAG7663708.1 hypothetical protein J8A68_002760 [[Candida] subhashii]
MKLYQLVIILSSLLSLSIALADQDDGGDATTTKVLPTIVWVTTTIDGAVQTVSLTYSQSFMTEAADGNTAVPSGEIGMGTLSGSVGGIRSYDQTTITNVNQGGGSGINIYTGVIGGLFMVLGLI